ncbi:MAG: NAD-dependent epimerase/dehydratase family protein [Myxococcales bacterium]|nr:NAD-dependent epimerase/dehydratase family protein [Myxococcales bacterium]
MPESEGQQNSVLESHDVRGARFVVTGGAGFIGSHLVRRLCDAGAERVTVVDSLRYGDVANLTGYSAGVELVQHTLGSDDIAELGSAVAGCDYLFHLAAEKHNQSKDEPTRVVRANIEGTLALYELAARAKVGRIVFSSSLYAYGRTSGGPLLESEVPLPRTVYGVSKLAGEHLLRYIEAQYGVPWVGLRYLFVYGPRQFAGMGYKSVILKSFERLLRGEAPIVFGDGEQALDYVFVDDVVEATLRAALVGGGGEVLNVASGVPTSVNDLLDLMIAISGRRVEKLRAPADWTAGTKRYGDPELAAERLGWRATTSLRDGLQRTWDWLREAG